MPELREALSSFRPTSNGADGNLVPVFTASLRETFNSADRSTEAIPPAMFVQVGASVAWALLRVSLASSCHHLPALYRRHDVCFVTLQTSTLLFSASPFRIVLQSIYTVVPSLARVQYTAKPG